MTSIQLQTTDHQFTCEACHTVLAVRVTPDPRPDAAQRWMTPLRCPLCHRIQVVAFEPRPRSLEVWAGAHTAGTRSAAG